MEDKPVIPESSQATGRLTGNNPEERRRRVCGPKSKFGCITCKKRHLKCDEAKPYCRRCKTDGWTCDGYKSKRYAIPAVTAFQPKSKFPTILSKTPFSNFPGTSEEHRFFHFFINKTASDLGLFSDNRLWSLAISRIAFTEKPVQHALIAVAALHEDHLREIELQDPTNQSFSLSQYNKAINSLNSRLSNDKSSYQITIVTCLLFIYLEFLKGSPQTALAHFESGLKLLPHYRRHIKDDVDMSSPGQGSKEASIDQELARTLSRFRKTTLGNDLIPLRLYGPVTNYGPLNTHTLHQPFYTLSDAEERLRPLVVHAFKEVYTINTSSRAADEAESTERQELGSHLRDWAVQIEKFIIRQRPSLSTGDLQTIRMLQIMNLMAIIWNMVTVTARQVEYDRCKEQFERLLSLVEEVQVQNTSSYNISTASWVNATSSIYDVSRFSIPELEKNDSQYPTKEGRSPTAVVDHSVSNKKLGVTFPLYFTAIKCRSPQLRRRALSQIPVTSPDSGTPGNSRFLKEVARYIIEFEEGQCRRPVTEDVATWPTEEQRIQMVYFLPIYDLKNKMQSAMFVQQPGGPTTEMKNWMKRFKL